MNMHKISVIVLLIILALAFFLRFYKLGEVPNGFYQDESAIGYNALSIIETGRDEHGESFPLYFASFGDYKLPVYIYSAIPSIKLFGFTEFAVRLPSALFGFLTVFVFYFFIKALTSNIRFALVGTLLLAINPWHLHYSRATFEVSISLFLFVLGGYLLNKAFQNATRSLFFLGTACFFINIYTYNLTRMLSPILFLLFLFFYRQKFNAVSKKELGLAIVACFLLLTPFIMTLFMAGGFSSAGGTFIASSGAVKAPLLELRSYFIDLPPLFTKVFFNMFVLTFWRFLENVASYASPSFLFISGSTHGNHGIGNVGQFYLFEFPIIVFGLYRIIREKISWGYFLLLWALVVIAVASLTREAPHATRSFFLVVPFTVFSAAGMLAAWNWIGTMKNAMHRSIFLMALAGLAAYSIVYYFTSYYVRFPVAYAKAWATADRDLSIYLASVSSRYEKIIFDKKAGFIYTSLLFYQKFPPSEFQQTAIYEPKDSEGMSAISRFAKYEFRDIHWEADLKDKNALIITTNQERPKESVVKATFAYPARPVVISTKQEILQYPVVDSAYVVVETEK